jgi:hypothetical protein
MVYTTSENYNLGQLRAKLLARQEYSVNHVSYRYYKVKSESREGEDDVTFIEKVSAMVEYSCRVIC